MAENKRYNLLDSLRGFAFLNMVLYHGLWDAVYLFGADIPWYTATAGFVLQQCICMTFILLSGFCWHFGRNQCRRGIAVLGASLLISAVTLLFLPQSRILFGVLSLIGSGMLLMIPLNQVLKRVNSYLGLVVCLLLFVLTKTVSSGILQIGRWELCTLPQAWYANLCTAYLGFPPKGFVSLDYFPLIPWLFLYGSGYFLYSVFQERNLLRFLTGIKIHSMEWIGRHCLILYLLHQPITYGVLYLLFSII